MRLRVLIADDHLEMMTALERLIEPTCEIVGRIADGAEVLDSVAKLLPDLLLVDLNMPGLDGLELCRRTVRAFPAVAVIVLSAEVDASLVQDAREAGAAAFINKLRAAEELPAAITVVRGQR
jgi:DNA-binding NarL/FixJ family response regulator